MIGPSHVREDSQGGPSDGTPIWTIGADYEQMVRRRAVLAGRTNRHLGRAALADPRVARVRGTAPVALLPTVV